MAEPEQTKQAPAEKESGSAPAATPAAPAAVSEEEEDSISGPLCFSCAKCRTIVGDSFSFLTSNEEAQTITLTASSNIQRSADVYTSKSGFDVGSTYFNFTCSNCQELLGRYYLTTSKDLDELREKFTFLVNNIQSYQLGKAQHGKLPELLVSADDGDDGQHEGGEGAAGSGSAASKTAAEMDQAGTRAVVDNLSKEVLKVQHVLAGFLERIERIESRFVPQQPQQQLYPGSGRKRNRA
jgi:hypothetical protein